MGINPKFCPYCADYHPHRPGCQMLKYENEAQGDPIVSALANALSPPGGLAKKTMELTVNHLARHLVV